MAGHSGAVKRGGGRRGLRGWVEGVLRVCRESALRKYVDRVYIEGVLIAPVERMCEEDVLRGCMNGMG